MAWFTAIGIGLSIAGTALDVRSKIKAGNAAKKAADLQADALLAASARGDGGVGAFNAKVAELQAKDALVRGAQEEGRYRAQVRGLLGTERVAYAAGNIDVSYGSAVDVQADTEFMGELDALQIRTNAAREAWGYQVTAANARAGSGGNPNAAAEAKFLRMQGKEAQSQMRLSIGGTLLGFGMNVANTYRPKPKSVQVSN